jgi:hypothetical protein
LVYLVAKDKGVIARLEAIKPDTKKIFLKLGTCSRTFCYLLNREFGCPMETGERAADPLAGGIMQRGHQCGMLWGSALAAGAESFRRHNDRGQAIAAAITATQRLVESFSKRTKSVNCRDITGYDLTKKIDLAKLMLKFFLFIRPCFELAEQWAPEAIQAVSTELSSELTGLTQTPVSCASEVAKKMGASDAEMVMVAGFAGGLGLSGNGCGALAAAIWMRSLDWCGKNPGKSAYNNPYAKNTLKAFYGATDSEFLCHKIIGQYFKTINDHTEFIKNGGCEKLINTLARA